MSMIWTSFVALPGGRDLLPDEPAGGYLAGQVGRGMTCRKKTMNMTFPAWIVREQQAACAAVGAGQDHV